MSQLKTIQYRGGIAIFQLPSSWVEEYEPGGGGTFYEPGDDTGTLRINVLEFEKQLDGTNSAPTAFDFLSRTRSVNEIEVLAAGAAVARYVTYGKEDGEDLRFFYWQICICISTTHFRIVVFTYTIVDGQEREPKMQAELQLLDRLIVAGEYPAVAGVTGDHYHEPAAQTPGPSQI
jgi:hypothetical protein